MRTANSESRKCGVITILSKVINAIRSPPSCEVCGTLIDRSIAPPEATFVPGVGYIPRESVWTLRATALAQLTQAAGPLPGHSERALLRMQLHDRKAKAMRLPLKSVNGRTPRIDADAWIADTATVVGDVSIGPTSSVYYSAVIRGDTDSITIGTRVNIQDAAVVHADPGFPARIGDDVSVGHGAVLHGCTVESGCLVGMNATILNGAVVGEQSLVAANALIPEGAVIPPPLTCRGSPWAGASRT